MNGLMMNVPLTITSILQHAERREVRQQGVRDLCDREDEHQVEEQFDEGDAVMLVRLPLPQQRSAGPIGHACSPDLEPFPFQ